jgi:2-oxoisovalerate dehydrogenase E2 component (dihydrolipoyl transacylase)
MTIVKMPQLGESVTEGTILKWMKEPGDPVKLDEPLCEIETEKVTAELPSPFEGTMGRILVPQGETVEVGAALCEVIEAGQARPDRAQEGGVDGKWLGGPMAIPPEESRGSPAPVAVAAPAEGAANRAKPDERGRFYSPAVMRLAREHAIDLASVQGTGIGGRVTRRDVERFLEVRPAAGVAPVSSPPSVAPPGEPFEVVTLSPTRKTIAGHLVRSNLEAPQAWTMVECDVTRLMALREREKERFARQEGVDLTLLPYFTATVCESLRAFPMLNARWEGDELRRYRAQNIAIAVATEHGLVTPVIHNAGDLSVSGLAKQIAELVERAHARKLRVGDIEGGTFTVNNTGTFGSIASKPIVNTPQVGIVTLERVVKRPVVVEGDAIAVRAMVNVCLSFDHRALDGYEAGGFLADLKRRLEAMG